ncbi:MAG: L-rhamnose mutarotase [Ignavibacteriae bacterium]|nr:L-rhamnose mutarotase [Ignavibacteriota bacterium]MCB9260484.1 L-rhamnose mutarotase [Ignavibacteriales bacterium]
MMRIAFKMKLHEGYEKEYIERHNPIWKELEELLYKQGVLTYSIFHDEETNILFGYAEIEDLKKWEAVADSAICREWWDYMAPLMEVNDDKSPVSKDLTEVFHIEH